MKRGSIRGVRKIKHSLSLKEINPVIRLLTISDIMVYSATALISPILAIFINEKIIGGTIEVAGIAVAVYMITKSIFQLPVAYFIDKIKGEKDDFWFMIIGNLLSTLVPLMYIFVRTPLELYFVQFFSGLIIAATFPTWLAIFTRHIDKEREGTEWAIYQTMVDFASAIFAFLSGFIVVRFGFNNLFILVAGFNFVSVFFLLGVYKYMKTGSCFLGK